MGEEAGEEDGGMRRRRRPPYKEIEEVYDTTHARGWNTNTTSNKWRWTRRMEVRGGGGGLCTRR
jgi:hypothetical protein